MNPLRSVLLPGLLAACAWPLPCLALVQLLCSALSAQLKHNLSEPHGVPGTQFALTRGKSTACAPGCLPGLRSAIQGRMTKRIRRRRQLSVGRQAFVATFWQRLAGRRRKTASWDAPGPPAQSFREPKARHAGGTGPPLVALWCSGKSDRRLGERAAAGPGNGYSLSSSNSRSFHGTPGANPPMPDSAITRWQGTARMRGFRAHAWATARAAPGARRETANSP
jgi:hypothetical protein